MACGRPRGGGGRRGGSGGGGQPVVPSTPGEVLAMIDEEAIRESGPVMKLSSLQIPLAPPNISRELKESEHVIIPDCICLWRRFIKGAICLWRRFIKGAVCHWRRFIKGVLCLLKKLFKVLSVVQWRFFKGVVRLWMVFIKETFSFEEAF